MGHFNLIEMGQHSPTLGDLLICAKSTGRVISDFDQSVVRAVPREPTIESLRDYPQAEQLRSISDSSGPLPWPMSRASTTIEIRLSHPVLFLPQSIALFALLSQNCWVSTIRHQCTRLLNF